MGDVLLDALLDTLKILPFLLVMNFLIELVEYGTKGLKANKLLNGGFAPLLGSAVGIVPQCGFSVVATELYGKRKIALGTLLAVYLATSDEALPIMLSSTEGLKKVLPVLIIKFCFAIIVGYATFGIEKLIAKKCGKSGTTATVKNGEVGSCDEDKTSVTTICDDENIDKSIDPKVVNDSVTVCKNVVEHVDEHEHNHEEHVAEHAHEHEHSHDENADNEEEIHVHGCHHHTLSESEKLPENATKKQKVAFVWRQYLKHPLLHTATVLLFILAVNVVFGIVVYYIGEERLAKFISSTGYLQPILSALVGLIPNCAASVVITEMYVVGALNLGGAVAGLCVSAGIGYAVLARQNKPTTTLMIIAITYVLSVVLGICITALGF